jgi:hypothetical protein
LTHGHPTGSLTAGVLAVLIFLLVGGARLPDALATAKTVLKKEPNHDETLRSILLAEELAKSALTPDVAIAQYTAPA